MLRNIPYKQFNPEVFPILMFYLEQLLICDYLIFHCGDNPVRCDNF